MSYEDVKKKSMMRQFQKLLDRLLSIFIRREALPESTVETSETYQKIKEVYEQIRGEDTFANFKKIYETYTVGTNTDGKTVAVEKETGYMIEDPKFVAKVRFVLIWRKVAIGNQDTKDEEAAKEVCFNAESEAIYQTIRDIVQAQLKKTGNIDTLAILNEMKQSELKWARSTSRRLFRNEIQTEIVTDYFRSFTPKIKKQTKKTLTTSQALYGLDEEM